MSYEIEVFARSNEGRYISLVTTPARGISSRVELRSALEILSQRFQDPEFSIQVNEIQTTVIPIPIDQILNPAELSEREALDYYINREVD